MKVEESLNVTFNESPPPIKLSPLVDNDVVPLPIIQSVIGTKLVFRNKLDENKARLVAQGYNQQKGIDYDETYAPVARLDSIRILLAIACENDFKLYHIDVKGAFLNGFINEEVYVAQPLGFIDFQKPNYVYKLKKALYGLKQAPKAWYDRLKSFLIKHEYSMGMVDNTLFTRRSKSHLVIVQIYVDDIIFGSTRQNLCDDFAKIMHDEFEMSMMGELNFFLGLQIKQMEDKIFFNQSKYVKEMLKKFGLEDSKPTKTPMSMKIKLTKDDEADSVDSSKYRGRTIDPSFYSDLTYDSGAKFKAIGFDCLLSLDDINNHHLNLLLAQFAELTNLPNQGICIYCDAWSLDELEKTLDQIEPYNSRLPALDDIRNLIHRRTVHEKVDNEGNTIHKLPNQIETNELFGYLRPCELVIRENVYSAIGNRDHTQAVIALMLYFLQSGQPFNLAYFIIRRMYFFRDRRDKVLPYGMILTRLFKNLKASMPQHPFDARYKLVPRKMSSLKAKQSKKPPSKRTRNVGKSKHT
ncbi:retrovirus-related pol polyprotein from transposon TNT 1-94 [Tanacetum coccineum]